jgi:hypothetical protein
VSCESASESCTHPASWEEVRITPASFNIRNAPFARGYFLGDYMGLDARGAARATGRRPQPQRISR